MTRPSAKASTHSTAGSRPSDVIVEASECIVKMRSKSILACPRVRFSQAEESCCRAGMLRSGMHLSLRGV